MADLIPAPRFDDVYQGGVKHMEQADRPAWMPENPSPEDWVPQLKRYLKGTYGAGFEDGCEETARKLMKYMETNGLIHHAQDTVGPDSQGNYSHPCFDWCPACKLKQEVGLDG